MYPKNAASPPRICVGSIYLISDGTIQTSGASVRVRPEGGSDAAGTGTLAYDTTSGAIFYTPAQSETNYTAFCVTVYKASCTSASVTVVTTAAGTAGQVVPEDGAITAAKLGADCITSAKIADDAISSEHLATGALTADAFAADALVAATFATGCFTADAFAANALVAATFAASSLDGKGDWNTVVPDPAGTVPVDGTLKVDIETIKTQTITCAASVTVGAYVGQGTAALTVDVAGRPEVHLFSVNGSSDDVTTLSYWLECMERGNVVDDVANTATTFKTDLGAASNDYYNGKYLTFRSAEADDVYQTRQIIDYDGTTKFVTLDAAFDAEPGVEQDFLIHGYQRNNGQALASDGMDSVVLPTDIITVASINTGAFTADAFAANALVAATFAASALNGKGDWSTHDAAAVLTALGNGLWATEAGGTGDHLTEIPSAGGLSAQQTRDAMKLAPSAGAPAAGSVDKHLDDIDAATGALAGSGARTVTITVDDGSNPLESAKVRVIKGAENYVQTTNVSGVCTFNLDDGTWSVAISLAGYTYTGTTLVVDGTEAETYSMTQSVIPASDPNQCTGYLYCYDENGAAESGVSVSVKAESPMSADGFGIEGDTQTKTTDANGKVQFDLWQGAEYKVRRESGNWLRFTAPSSSGTFAITSVIG